MVALGHCTADRGDIRRNRNRKIGDKIRLRQDKQQRLKYSGAVSYLPSTTHCLVCRAGVLGCWGAGVLECWGAGVLGCWGAGVLGCSAVVRMESEEWTPDTVDTGDGRK